MPRTPSSPVAPQSLSHALALKIRKTLDDRGWSQREFARRLGVTQGAVSYLLAEKRRASVLDYYDRLARIFGVRLSVLIAELEVWIDESAPGPVVPVRQAALAEALQRERGTAQTIGAILDAVLDAMQTSRGGVTVLDPAARPLVAAASPRPRAVRSPKAPTAVRRGKKALRRRGKPPDGEPEDDPGPARLVALGRMD